MTGVFNDNEVSDVTNALLDGANGLVLREGFNIEHVLETIKSLNELLRTVEPYANTQSGFWRLIDEVRN